MVVFAAHNLLQRSAVLAARPDLLPQSADLSRAGGCRRGSSPLFHFALRAADICSSATPRQSGGTTICSRRCRRSGGSIAGSGRRRHDLVDYLAELAARAALAHRRWPSPAAREPAAPAPISRAARCSSASPRPRC